MRKERVRLSSAEIGGLWTTYLQESMALCLLTYFLHHNQDKEIKKILENAYEISDKHVEKIKVIFEEEGIPLPKGFTKQDVHLDTPPLFYDSYGLSFVYAMSRMGMINTSFLTVNVARNDIVDFFVKMIQETTFLYQNSTSLLLSKGVYDRPPMIPYPKTVEYVEKLSYLSGFGKKRPLNAVELTELFFNTERNYFSILLCTGLLQVVKDKEIHQFIKEGKKISEKQINTFNDVLTNEELFGNVVIPMEVTDSTISPFSDRLIVTLFNALNTIDITLIGHALSLSMRTDLLAKYQKYMAEVLIYSAKGFNIMVDRGWMQEIPHTPDREKLQKLK